MRCSRLDAIAIVASLLLFTSPPAAQAAECKVNPALDESHPYNPGGNRVSVTVESNPPSPATGAYGGVGLPGRSANALTPAQVETRDIAIAISHRDLAELTRLLPQEAGARRDVLRRTHAILSTFSSGALAIAQRILQWDPDALKVEPRASLDRSVSWLADSWQRTVTARGRLPDPPSDADYLGLLRILLDAGASADGDPASISPLALVAGLPASAQSVSAASLLVDRGASLNAKAKWARAPLAVAAETKNAAVLEVILRKARPSKENLDEALGWAPVFQDNKAIPLLLAKGANVNALGKLKNPRPDYSAAAEASGRVRFNGERDLMRLLLRYKIDLKAPAGKTSALGILAKDLELLPLLLAGGADPNHAGANGDTPLLLATRVPRSGGMVVDPDPPPDSAVRTRAVELLLAAGADPSIANKEGVTPLMQSLRDETALVHALLAKGGTVRIDPRLAESYRREGTPVGPVSWAVLQGKDALGAGLIARERKIGPDDCGAVYYAALSGSARSLSALLDAKAPVYEARDAVGMTPLIVAAYAGEAAAVKILLDRRAAKVDETTPAGVEMVGNGHGPSMPGPVGGETALMWAARNGRVEAVQELLRQGADVNRRSLAGATALDFARRSGKPEVAAVLQSHGAR